MAWTEIDKARLIDGELTLHRDEAGQFMIRAHGLELMNGHCHRSETVLGALAVALAPCRAPRILIGGLGLGFTLKAALAALPADGQLVQAELSPEVVRWFHTHFAPALSITLPPHAKVVTSDVRGLLQPSAYDVIALDVDNGPDPLTLATNGALYSADGLAHLRAALSHGGKLLVWSAFQAPAFLALGRQAGFAARELAVETGVRADFLHYIYVFATAPLCEREAALCMHHCALAS